MREKMKEPYLPEGEEAAVIVVLRERPSGATTALEPCWRW